MKPSILGVVCDPITRDPLEIEIAIDSQGRKQESLVNRKTGKSFPIRNGIPIFLENDAITGSNKKYQSMYDRFAPLYDFSTWAYSNWKGMNVETRLREYLDELEVKERPCVGGLSGHRTQFAIPTAQVASTD
jgi:uncharacterized protein YbaR (Trm112 family)